MTRFPLAAIATLGLVWGGLHGGQAIAGEAAFSTTSGVFSVRVTSLRESLFSTVVRQEHDFSCGSAALATLLTYHYGRPISEKEVFTAMFEAGDQQAIQQRGFSMADMQRYLTVLGYRSDGYQVPLAKLVEAGVPAITLINTRGYNHFVVIKGIKDGDVLVGDPAIGLRSVPQAEFEAMSQGIIFVIRDDPDTGRKNFNRSEEWMVRRKPPLGAAVDRQLLGTFLATLPGIHEF